MLEICTLDVAQRKTHTQGKIHKAGKNTHAVLLPANRRHCGLSYAADCPRRRPAPTGKRAAGYGREPPRCLPPLGGRFSPPRYLFIRCADMFSSAGAVASMTRRIPGVVVGDDHMHKPSQICNMPSRVCNPSNWQQQPSVRRRHIGSASSSAAS